MNLVEKYRMLDMLEYFHASEMNWSSNRHLMLYTYESDDDFYYIRMAPLKIYRSKNLKYWSPVKSELYNSEECPMYFRECKAVVLDYDIVLL